MLKILILPLNFPKKVSFSSNRQKFLDVEKIFRQPRICWGNYFPCCNLPPFPSDDALWTLEERRVRADLIEVCKIIYRISSVSFDTFFKYNNYGATRGHSLKLTKRRASTELRHHFFSERVINIWNSFDNRTVTSGSVDIFKGNLERLRQSKEIDLFVGN